MLKNIIAKGTQISKTVVDMASDAVEAGVEIGVMAADKAMQATEKATTTATELFINKGLSDEEFFVRRDAIITTFITNKDEAFAEMVKLAEDVRK